MISWDLKFDVLCANYDQTVSGYGKTPDPLEGDGTALYDFGKTVKVIKDLGRRIEAEYENQDGKKVAEKADLLVGADGPSSTVRKLLVPKVSRE